MSARKPKYGIPPRNAASGSQVPRSKTEWSPEKIEESLADYTEVEREQWSSIPPGGSIRYFIIEGEQFRSGGVVLENPKKCKNELTDASEDTMVLADTQTRTKRWVVYYSKLLRVYYKPDPVMHHLNEAMKALNNNTNRIVDAIKSLRERVDALEKEKGHDRQRKP